VIATIGIVKILIILQVINIIDRLKQSGKLESIEKSWECVIDYLLVGRGK
jgi:hypothetical protein